MGDTRIPRPDEVMGIEETIALLEVTRDRVEILIEAGLLNPVGGPGELQFYRGEVIAVRELGG